MTLQNYIHQPVRHPVFTEGQQLLTLSLIQPEKFHNFIKFFIENKNFFFYQVDNQQKKYIGNIASKNEVMNIQVQEWNIQNKIEQLFNKNWDERSKEEIHFGRELYCQYSNMITSLMQYFLEYPDKYQKYGNKKLPPIFVFTKKITDQSAYFGNFERIHIETLLTHSNNKNYFSFVTNFLASGVLRINGGTTEISEYLLKLFEKNLPLEELIEPVKKDLAIYTQSTISENFEDYLRNRYQDFPEMSDIYLTYRKIRLEQRIDDRVPVKNITTNKLKI